MAFAMAACVASASVHSPVYSTYVGRELRSETSEALYDKLNMELRRRLDVSDFLSRCELLNIARGELETLRKLPRDWNSYSAETPNDTAFALAYRILVAATGSRLAVTRIVPSADGGIGICFVREGRYAHIEASNEGEMTLVVIDRSDRSPEVAEIHEDADLTIALGRIRDAIGL